MRYTLIGCGYTGERIAPRLRGRVEAFTGSEASAARLRARGIEAQAWDLDRPVPGDHGLEVTDAAILYLAPPPPGGETDPRLRTFLAALDGRPARLVYLSTTGVYGDAQGATVTEDTPPNPSTGRARARLDAEAALRAWCGRQDVEWTILRVPGIYGPGRLPLERLRRRDPVLAEEEAGPGNRIHVDDLASVCIAAATSPRAACRIYNVGDGDHASSTTYFNAVARIAGLPPPPVVSREEARLGLSPGAWSFLAESRRVDTTRMRQELGVTLRYADLEAGIRASL
jgi:nucleoside-diphosphate-sugar epimerase